ncbi:uncharacterized protein LOC128216137 [Mya arenaria]|uniref:uncharacterized protein LOC128216137 n=1 Tax=Mya arenaria TaxID=6604 RepID=UPI0022DF7DC9|nr:uncharacterized protein LOC128216137 [Mya arenaria]
MIQPGTFGKKHAVLGRKDVKKWEASLGGTDALERCGMHPGEALKLTRAAIYDDIKTIRKKINEILDKIEKTTLQDLDGMIAELEKTLKKDIETCNKLTIELQNMIAAFQTKAKSSESKSYIAYRKSQDKISQSNDQLRGIAAFGCYNVTFQANNFIEELLFPIKTFGAIEEQSVMTKQPENHLSDPNHIFSVAEYKEYNVEMSDDEGECAIRGVCELPSGEFVIADWNNCKVKLLDKEYRMLDHCNFLVSPWDVCHIDGNDVAVCVGNELYFINATKGKFKTTRKLSFSHRCFAAAHHCGQLYISSKNALYVYTMSGKKVKKLYEDFSGIITVEKCAISNDGETIYITNSSKHKLITLDNKGNMLSSLTDPDMKSPTGVHVTPAGHVFVCCCDSDTVLQVDKDGKKKLATLAREEDGVKGPHGLFFSSSTSSLIVGGVKDTLLVIKLN